MKKVGEASTQILRVQRCLLPTTPDSTRGTGNVIDSAKNPLPFSAPSLPLGVQEAFFCLAREWKLV